jgi:prepilin-type N-terminal cleavage/methylation domain-containing protein
MKTRDYKTGFTLIEMLLVVAIIAILVSMVIRVARHFDDQSRERLCRTNIALIGNALEQFREFGFVYKDNDYAGLTFPLDCNGFNVETTFEGTLHNALYSANPLDPPIITINNWAQHDPNYSGSEALYFILSQVPDCRITLGKIDKSLLTNKGIDKTTDITIAIGAMPAIPFTRIIDPWGTTLRYDYYPEYADYAGTWANYLVYRNSAKKTFPVITSAGPDKKFDTADDITNVR